MGQDITLLVPDVCSSSKEIRLLQMPHFCLHAIRCKALLNTSRTDRNGEAEAASNLQKEEEEADAQPRVRPRLELHCERHGRHHIPG
mmetsp:Transcript_10780/g.14995  ORF Transcript_10780/g.14995 Transcript_10780/m.14995 type:complete len:87 (+) Transcript_10780:936-1196(+)